MIAEIQGQSLSCDNSSRAPVGANNIQFTLWICSMSATVDEKIWKLILEYWIILPNSTENDASKIWSLKVSSPWSLSSSGVQIWRLPCDTYLPAPLPAVWVVYCRGHHKEHSRYKSHSRPDFSPPSDPLVCPLLFLHHDSWQKFWLKG